MKYFRTIFIFILTAAITLFAEINTMGKDILKKENNLLKNGDFSELKGSNQIKDWTVRFQGKGLKGKYSVVKGPTGKNALRIECTKFPLTRKSKWIILSQDKVKTTGKNLYISMWLKKEKLTSTFIHLWIANLSPFSVMSKALLPVSEEWRKVEKIIKTRKNDNTRFEIFFTKPGVLYVSDIIVRETSKSLIDFNPIRKKMEAENAISGTKNLVFNGSFEVGAEGWGTSFYDYSVLKIDDAKVFIGKKSARLDFDKKSLPAWYVDYSRAKNGIDKKIRLVTKGWIRLKKDKTYTLSLYMNSNLSRMPIKIGVDFMNDKSEAKTVRVKDKWQRYEITFKAKDIFAFPWIRATTSKFNEKLWIDAVQLEEAWKATEFVPKYPVEIALSPPRTGGIYYNNEDISLKMNCFGKTSSPRNSSFLFLEVFDYRGEKVYETKISLNDKTKHINLPLRGKNGHYKIKAKVSGNDFEYKITFPIAIIYPYKEKYPQASSWFGINHWYYTDLLQDISKDGGVTWVRDWTLKWSHVEPEKGKFDFKVVEKFQKRAEKFKLKLLSILPDPSASWISSAPPEVRNKKLGDAYAQDWYLPKDFKFYRRYVRTCMEKFHKTSRVWEVLNEPYKTQGWTMDKVYDKFLKIVNEEVRKTDKDLKVMRCGLGYMKLKANIAARRLSSLISEHSYPNFNSSKIFLKSWRITEKYLIDNNIKKKIWVTEYGKYADDNPHYNYASFAPFLTNGDERTSSAYSIKYFAIILSHGGEKIFFHLRSWGLGLNKKNNYVDFDMFFKYGAVPRKFFVAANAFSWILKPGTSTGTPVTEGPVYGYVFSRKKDKVLIVWTDKKERSLTKKLKLLVNKTEIFNMMGKRLESISSFGDEPLYICGKTSIIDEISKNLKYEKYLNP